MKLTIKTDNLPPTPTPTSWQATAFVGATLAVALRRIKGIPEGSLPEYQRATARVALQKNLQKVGVGVREGVSVAFIIASP